MGKRRTHEEFVDSFYNRKNDNVNKIDIVGKYIDSKTKILCKCKICNNEWEIRPDSLLAGSGCPKCANIDKSENYKGRHIKQNPELLKQKFLSKYRHSDTNIELLGEYINSDTKIKVKCKKHETIWEGNPRSILKGIGCKECRNEKFSKTMLKTQKQFEDEIKLINPKIKIIGKYTGCENKISCECLDCGFKWDAHIQPLLNGRGCRKCSSKLRGKNQRLTENEFLSKLNNTNKNIIPLEPYIDSHTKILFKCKIDGYVWEAEPTNILQSRKCPVCTNRVVVKGVNDIATTHPNIIKYLCNIDDGCKYVYGSNDKINVRCPDCGFEKKMTVHSLATYGFSCDRCSDKISYPNKFIRGFIQQCNVDNIVYEYNPTWAKLYKYDVYFEYKSQKYIIEMDGGFHYIVTNLRTENDLRVQKKRDNEKNILAKNNNIILIRIDSRKSDGDYIKNNITKSDLSNILDLTNIDWNLCDNYGNMNVIKVVCDFYNKSKNKSTIFIADHFKMERHTILKYLKVGAKYNLCDYNVKKSIQRRIKSTSCPINVFDDKNNLIYNFSSITETSREMKNMYGNGFSVTSIKNRCIDGKNNNGFIFKYAN